MVVLVLLGASSDRLWGGWCRSYNGGDGSVMVEWFGRKYLPGTLSEIGSKSRGGDISQKVSLVVSWVGFPIWTFCRSFL